MAVASPLSAWLCLSVLYNEACGEDVKIIQVTPVAYWLLICLLHFNSLSTFHAVFVLAVRRLLLGVIAVYNLCVRTICKVHHMIWLGLG